MLSKVASRTRLRKERTINSTIVMIHGLYPRKHLFEVVGIGDILHHWHSPSFSMFSIRLPLLWMMRVDSSIYLLASAKYRCLLT